MKKIFVTGGAGYCGGILIPKLLSKGYNVKVYDSLFFTDDFLPTSNSNLIVSKGDIRDEKKIYQEALGYDVFINLACISNDASFELNENLSTSINMNAFEPMVLSAKKANIQRFIYASSSSVYGVSDSKNVTEEHPLVPLTLYNKYKGLCEPILFKHTNENFNGVIFRPATVCGYSPRMRFDLSVNILTHHAIKKNKITVFGGEQLRPNLHIQDYCDLVCLLIEVDKAKISNQIFNVGYQNLSIIDIAKKVKKVVLEEFPEKINLDIIRTESDDKRSYHINSDKIKKILDFEPARSIEDAIRDLCKEFKKNNFSDSETNNIYYNVKRIKELDIT